MRSVLFKMACVNAWYFNVKLNLFNRWHPEAAIYYYARKRIQHEIVDRIDKSVPWVTVWHHSPDPHDAIQ